MTDEQINGAAAQVQGKAQKAFGNLVGDQKMQVEGAFNDAKGRSLETFGKAMDAIDRLWKRRPPITATRPAPWRPRRASVRWSRPCRSPAPAFCCSRC